MLDNPLETFWLYSCLDKPYVPYHDLQEYPDVIRDRLLDLGFLKEGPASQSIMCNWCGEDAGEVEMIERVDGTRVFTAYCPECGLLHVEPDQMRQWFPDYTAVAEWLGRQLQCRGNWETVLPQKLWNVGRAAIAGQSRPIWVARTLDEDTKRFLPDGKQPIFFVIFPQYDRAKVSDPDRMFSISELTHIESGELRFDVEVVHDQIESVMANLEPAVPVPRKDAKRASVTKSLKNELHQHILSMKSLLANTDEKLPRLTQRELATRLGETEPMISRILKEADELLRILWQTANDPDMIRRYARRA